MTQTAPERTRSRSRGGSRALVTICVFAFAASCSAIAATDSPAASDDASEATDAKPNTWYAAAIASSRSGALVTHYWSKGARMRAELVVGGQRLVTIINGRFYYSLDPVSGTGLRIERSAKAQQDDTEDRRWFGGEGVELESAGAEKLRSETLGRVEVDVLQLTDRRGRRRVWVTPEEPRVTYRVEVFDRMSKTTSTTNYSGWHHGLDIKDSFFEPDSNLEIEELSYDEFRSRARQGRVGTAPALYPELLHGTRE